MKKKLFILFSLLGICFGISLPLFLNNNKAEAVSAEAVTRDLVYNDLILYDVGDIDNPQPNKVYSFNINTITTAGTFNILYFEQGSFKLLNTGSGSMRLNIVASGDLYTASLQYRLTASGSFSTLLNFIGPNISVVFKTFTSPVSTYTNFITNFAIDGAIPVYKTDSDYYSQLFTQISNLNTQVQGLNSQISILQSSIQEKESLIAQKNATILQLNSQNEALHNEVVSIQNEYDILEAQYQALEISYEDLISSEASLLTFINGFIHSTLNSEYTANTLTQGVAYLNTRILSNQEEIESLTSQISQLDEQIEADDRIINQLNATISDLEAQVDSLYATSSVFGLIRSAFAGVVPLLDLELMPNITIGMILTIPFVLAVLGFILKALG